MKKGTIHNKEGFLNSISDKLGRDRKTGVSLPVWEHQPQWKIYSEATSDELAVIFQESSEEKDTLVVKTDQSMLSETLEKVMNDCGGGPIVTTKDPRFSEYGLTSVLDTDETHVWDVALGEKNIQKAKEANIGVIFSDISLAESGTVVQFNDKNIARSVCLLPITYVAIVPKSTIVPRMTQATHHIHKQVEAGKDLATNINFMSGPSNSADIEMDIVVGVHGPVKAVYIVVEDQ